jgi:hypothetical protein
VFFTAIAAKYGISHEFKKEKSSKFELITALAVQRGAASPNKQIIT